MCALPASPFVQRTVCAGPDAEADRIEADVRAVASPCIRIATAPAPRAAAAGSSRAGGDAAAEPEHPAPGQDHSATRASSAAGTCQSTTWACGTSTPGWPALK